MNPETVSCTKGMKRSVSPPSIILIHEVEEEPVENLMRMAPKWRVGHGTGEKQLVQLIDVTILERHSCSPVPFIVSNNRPL